MKVGRREEGGTAGLVPHYDEMKRQEMNREERKSIVRTVFPYRSWTK